MGNVKRERKSQAKEKRESAREITFRAVFMRSSRARSAREHSDLSPKRFPFSWFLSVALYCLVFCGHDIVNVEREINWKWFQPNGRRRWRISEWIGLLMFDTWSCGQPNDVNMRDIYWAIKLNIWSRIRCNPISRSCVRSNFMTRKLPRRTQQTRQIVLIALE